MLELEREELEEYLIELEQQLAECEISDSKEMRRLATQKNLTLDKLGRHNTTMDLYKYKKPLSIHNETWT